jgi:hypothetical protein
VKLTRVTITGADDAVDPQALLDLSLAYPFVEWGLLRSRKLNEVQGSAWYRTGAPRYPSPLWRDSFGHAATQRGVPINLAAHLCGILSREALAGEDQWWHQDSLSYQRIQLNGFSKFMLPMLRCANLHPGATWILQVQDWAPLKHAGELAAMHENVAGLWDKSGGRGVADKSGSWFDWPWSSGVRLGYAGGINPDNAAIAAEQVTRLIHGTGETWLDMESGVRTDDRFDIGKVRAVLAAVKPFVSEAA